jgi:hypothetical protein
VQRHELNHQIAICKQGYLDFCWRIGVVVGCDRRIHGPEAVLAYLSRVSLFASAESETTAELAACVPQSLRLAGIRDHLGSTLAMLREVRQRAAEFDIIHFHVDLLPHALFYDLSHKCLSTLHGRLDLPDALPLYQAYPEMAPRADLPRCLCAPAAGVAAIR